MQFSLFTLAAAAAMASTATAQYAVSNGTETTAALYPTGTGSAHSSGSAPSHPKTTSTAPFVGGAASNMAGSAMGLIVVGGIALVCF
jgi:di/tricarboxylate transporter